MSKKSILFYGGNFNPNKITKAFINLVNKLDFNTDNVFICIQMDIINSSKVRLEEFNKIDKNIMIINRAGKMLMTQEEKKIYNFFEINKKFENKEMEDTFSSIYTKEYIRIFGHRFFDAIVHFEGHSLFWQRLFSYAPMKSVKSKSIYLHHNMDEVWKKQYPKLEFNFMLYNKFTYLISSSEELMVQNSINLASKFKINQNNFFYLPEIHNPQDILISSRALLTDKNLFFESQVFINIARLIEENGQEMILFAFRKLLKHNPNTKLVYLGVGDLENKLRSLIKELKLTGKVFLLGQRFNSYAYLQQANCLVDASSSFEQSMILREAYFMKKPIITTKTETHQHVLQDKKAVFVENTVEGVYGGMLAFLDKNSQEQQIFNYDEYNQHILTLFYQKIILNNFPIP